MVSQSGTLEVRQRHYPYDQTKTKYYDSNNVYLTAEWQALSMLFPAGEMYFVRSVRRLAHQAKSSHLKKQLDGFAGQEASHAKETYRSLDPLRKQGIPVGEFLSWFEGLLKKLENFPDPRIHLAATAAVEHFTAISVGGFLKQGYYDRFEPVMREYWRWHAAEELEHKAVAYDLLKDVAPYNYPIRILFFIIAMGIVYFSFRKAIRLVLKVSGLNRKQLRQEKKRAKKIRVPLFSMRLPHFFRFFRPGFHPNELDDSQIPAATLAAQSVELKV